MAPTLLPQPRQPKRTVLSIFPFAAMTRQGQSSDAARPRRAPALLPQRLGRHPGGGGRLPRPPLRDRAEPGREARPRPVPPAVVTGRPAPPAPGGVRPPIDRSV